MKLGFFRWTCLVVGLSLSMGIVSATWAAESTEATTAADPMVQETLNDLMAVVGLGAAGAVLGLSTLPFYSKPKEHVRNILMGGAVGIIAGVGLVAYLQATKNQEALAPTDTETTQIPSANFEGPDRLAWHSEQNRSLVETRESVRQLAFTFVF